MAIKNLFPGLKTTDEVLAAFSKTVEALAGVHEKHAALAEEKAAQAARLADEAQDARRESLKAKGTLERFQALIGAKS